MLRPTGRTTFFSVAWAGDLTNHRQTFKSHGQPKRCTPQLDILRKQPHAKSVEMPNKHADSQGDMAYGICGWSLFETCAPQAGILYQNNTEQLKRRPTLQSWIPSYSLDSWARKWRRLLGCSSTPCRALKRKLPIGHPCPRTGFSTLAWHGCKKHPPHIGATCLVGQGLDRLSG